MMVDKLPEISKGASKHIARDLKPELRRAENEEEAWEATEEILKMRIEGYPEHFSSSYFVIRAFHRIRWEMRTRLRTAKEMKNKEMTARFSELMSKYPEEALDQARDIFGIITQIYSR